MSCLFPETIPEEGSLESNPSSVAKAKEFGIILASA